MKFIFALSLVVMMNANATVESTGTKSIQPSETEIQKNRACFQYLEVLGCGDAGEDPDHFRSCLGNVHPTLDDHCQRLMLELYGTK